uniref:Uncharacterized protein n=1 Tax=Canis lupus dingo TaxID=286419 RepID=A0A8C0K6X1_CANLU
MASIPPGSCVSSASCIQAAEVGRPLRSRKWKERKKNQRSLMWTWALVFLTTPLS